MESQRKIFVEKVGVRTEKMGYSPLAGRIIGALLLAEPPYMTFDSLCEYLNASKSSISTNLQFLMHDGSGMVEYFTLPGDRKRYFKISIDNWVKHIKEIPKEFQQSKDLLEEILSYRKSNMLDNEFSTNIEELLSFYEFMLEKLPTLIEEWEERRKKNN
ncbi:MAG: hypothetical protein LC105_10525 [Chitinophagales bacterium]|nr:hypothetical protein [Chitinophagales bacterium]MCZ2394283.1 hypothetical protein [Chitinophagales bacterium]